MNASKKNPLSRFRVDNILINGLFEQIYYH